MSDIPEYTTAFAIVQSLDGSISVVTEVSGVDTIREPNRADIVMMSRYVYDILSRPDSREEMSQADKIRERLAHRKKTSQEGSDE